MALELAGPISGTFFAGNHRAWVFSVTQDGVAVNISGATGRFVMARKPGSDAALSTESSPQTVTASITDAAAGEFTVSVSADNTQNLLGTYLYQAQIEDSSGNKSNVLHGYFTFKKNMI